MEAAVKHSAPVRASIHNNNNNNNNNIKANLHSGLRQERGPLRGDASCDEDPHEALHSAHPEHRAGPGSGAGLMVNPG